METRILSVVAGLAIALMGLGYLILSQFPMVREFIGDGSGYLPELLQRSLNSPGQAAMLACWCAVLLHGIVTIIRKPKPHVVKAYEKFAGWVQTLFTSVGFLGTIIGISIAVSGLESAMQQQEPAGLIAGLSTAFDTTFLGLGAAITTTILRKIIHLRTEE